MEDMEKGMEAAYKTKVEAFSLEVPSQLVINWNYFGEKRHGGGCNV